jgi:hypothetical protein
MEARAPAPIPGSQAHGAKRADGRQRARLGTAQGVIVAVIVDVLSFEATRQADVLHEHIAGIHRLAIARIGTTTAASALFTGVLVAIPWIVAPSRIVTSHGAPPEDAQGLANQGGRKSIKEAPDFAGTKRGQSGAVSGGRGLPPDHGLPNKNGPDCLVRSQVV